MIGDTTADMLCGKAAGSRTVGVAWGANGREKLLNVIPSSLTPKGSARVEMLTLPEPVPAVLEPKKGFVFRWKYKADYIGTLRFRGNAIAEDVKEQAVDSLSTFSNVLTVFEP